MSALYLLVLASIAVAAFFLFAFIWSVRSNQFEDQEGSAMRMLHDNETPQSNKRKI
ncbi:MAG TPA: cbb3-type cytochrome oxidase assembly protein CcoS [Flavipsychrobacter sp.]